MVLTRSKTYAPPLPHPWTGDDYGDGLPPIMLPELVMMAASNAIREKPEWWRKLADPTIAARWKEEIVAESRTRSDGNDGAVLRDAQVEYVFQELQWHAQHRQKQLDQGIEAPIEYAIDNTRRSDHLIPQDLKQRFLACVDKLMNIPECDKDWHPGSNNQVLDIVHPSLFCFVAGRTRVTKQDAIPALNFIGRGDVANEMPEIEDAGNIGNIGKYYYSKKYHWLPTDFEVSGEGKVNIKSYINNLHPLEHKEMYPVLGEIFEKFLPMFEQVLGDMLTIQSRVNRLEAKPYDWYVRPDFEEAEDEDAAWDEWYENRVPTFPDIPKFETIEPNPVYDLRNKTLQVIVKMANIELTPENPTYSGGTWHVEGMANERIVASGIYYYKSENISTSRLNFRMSVCEPDYEQSDDTGMKYMYNLENDAALVQPLDGIVTKEDRCIVFPNIFQHQVQPFELADKTKPGSRGILVFFLVDPSHPILSTTNVPPQQKAWADSQGMLDGILDKVPLEIFQQIEGYVDWPMDLKEAKEHREKLMAERKFFVAESNEGMFERPFSLCEH
ncbi:hypothetical protein BGZ73_004149 [Actinomortierella ambigua]|nr:hypothetical protein BGZ73_004149 [Actinomortierella ambigua]